MTFKRLCAEEGMHQKRRCGGDSGDPYGDELQVDSDTEPRRVGARAEPLRGTAGSS